MRSIDRLVRSHGAGAIIKYLVSSRALQAEELYNLAAEIEEDRIDTLLAQEADAFDAKLEVAAVTCEREDEADQIRDAMEGRR